MSGWRGFELGKWHDTDISLYSLCPECAGLDQVCPLREENVRGGHCDQAGEVELGFPLGH